MKQQTQPYSIEQYIDAGCGQFPDGRPDLIIFGLHGFTKGMLCNGCPHHSRGCQAFKTLSAQSPTSKPQPIQTETVRDEAARRGVSISEVRRNRNAAGA